MRRIEGQEALALDAPPAVMPATKPDVVLCAWCERPIIQHRGRGRIKKTCSQECQDNVSRGRAKEAREKVEPYYSRIAPEIRCKNCDEPIPYQPGKYRRGYCDQCRLQAIGTNRRNQKLLRRLSRYGLALDQYRAMLDAQEGRCAVCRSYLADDLAIDHDHSCCASNRSCGRCIRGLLCHQCNCGLGNFLDDPERLLAAALYLEKSLATSVSR